MEQDDALIVLLLLYPTITHGCYIWSIIVFLLKVTGHNTLIVLYSTIFVLFSNSEDSGI